MIGCLCYEPEYAGLWDKFVLNNAVNGTFLQTRNFLSYHPQERFADDSFLICDTLYNIYAVVPGCGLNVDGVRTFVSHPGSTFGGIVINKIRYSLKDVLMCVDLAESYLKSKGYQRIILKLTPDLFSVKSSDLLQYLLRYQGYSEYTDLNTCIDFSDYNPDIKMNFNNAKRGRLKKCEALGMRFARIESAKDIVLFYAILEENLLKHGAKPIHTVDELIDFMENRLKGIVSFHGVFIQDDMVAGAMVFSFGNGKVLHFQNTVAMQSYNHVSPISFLLYKLICYAHGEGYEKVSFGISTENKGRVLNTSLAESKEAYGGGFSVNRTFHKDI